jgi:hypothetical protein
MSSLYQIERISSENSVQLLLDQGIVFLLNDGFKYLGYEIDHGLEKVLILENHFTLPMTQKNSHVDITDLFALLL